MQIAVTMMDHRVLHAMERTVTYLQGEPQTQTASITFDVAFRTANGIEYFPKGVGSYTIQVSVTYSQSSMEDKCSVRLTLGGKTFYGDVPETVVSTGEYWNAIRKKEKSGKMYLTYRCNKTEFDIREE